MAAAGQGDASQLLVAAQVCLEKLPELFLRQFSGGQLNSAPTHLTAACLQQAKGIPLHYLLLPKSLPRKAA